MGKKNDCAEYAAKTMKPLSDEIDRFFKEQHEKMAAESIELKKLEKLIDEFLAKKNKKLTYKKVNLQLFQKYF